MVANKTKLVLISCAGLSCTPSLQEVEPFDDASLNSRIQFPDTVVSFGPTGSPFDCLTGALTCNPSQSSCSGPDATLGAPDASNYDVAINTSLILANGCGAFLENGGVDTMDIRIYGDAPANTTMIVDVSFDANEYVTLGDIRTGEDPMNDEGFFDFDLGRVDLESFQFIRFTVIEGGPFQLDAVENLSVAL